jgi:hypothetical protein
MDNKSRVDAINVFDPMAESANGELPLHSHVTDSHTFAYADYWKLLTASSSTVSGSPRNPAFSAPSSTPATFIHAATGAYRLRLSLSPNSKLSSPEPLSGKSRNTHVSLCEGDTVGRKAASAAATPLFTGSARDENVCDDVGGKDKEGAPESTSSCVALRRRLARNESPYKHADRSHSSQMLGVRVVDESSSLKESDPYAVDAQVLQAVRCYEEWRRCLCAADDEEATAAAILRALPSPPDMAKASHVSDGASTHSSAFTVGRKVEAPEGLLTTAEDEAKQHPDCRLPDDSVDHREEAVEEICCSPITTPSPSRGAGKAVRVNHVQQAHMSATRHHSHSTSLLSASAAQKNASLSSSTSPSDVAGDAVNQSRSVHSNDTHGLTNARAEREASESASALAASTSVTAAKVAAAAAVPPASSTFLWNLGASPEVRFTSVSPFSSQELGEQRPCTQDLTTAASQARRAVSMFVSIAHVSHNYSPTEGTKDSENVVSGPSQRQATPFTFETICGSINGRVAASAKSTRASPPPSSVQRRLFTDTDDDYDVDDRGDGIAAAADAEKDRGTSGLIPQRTGVFTLAEGTAVAAAHNAGGRTFDEMLIELSCTSSCSSSPEACCSDHDVECDTEHSATAAEDYMASFLHPDTAVESDGSGGEQQPQPSPSLVSTASVTAANSACEDQQANECTVENRGSATSSDARCHPLFAKHHATVAALYTARLLESEVHNDELQLFLCWAHEKAERRARHWQRAATTGLPEVVTTSTKGRHTWAADAAEEEEEEEAPLLTSDTSSVLSASPAEGVTAFTVTEVVRDVYRSAYMRRLGARAPCVNASAAAVVADSAHQRADLASLSRRPVVYVASPVGSEQPTDPAAASPPPRRVNGNWVTPSSTNSRFIAWVADDVDVYEGLLM